MKAIARLVPPTGSGPFVRAVGAMLLGFGGIAIFAGVLDRIYPVRDWLIWSMAPLWAWALFLNLACLGFGQLVLVRFLKLTCLRASESAVLSMAIGTVGFVLAMYVGGSLACFTPAFAVLLPVLMLALGARDEFRLFMRWRGEMLDGRWSALSALAIVFGISCIGLVYLGLMTPNAVNYDSAWFHLRISQDYARWGRIAPFYDHNSIVPHLASILYTWGYLVPGLDGAQRWMMALHLEFSLFLWTLAGVASGVQTLLKDHQIKGTWSAFFLFPMIFVYDSNLGGASDHVLAFFSVPIVLATLQVLNEFTKGRCALLGITLAGAMLTKYQAVYLIGPVVIIVLIAWLGAWTQLARHSHGVMLASHRSNLKWAPIVLIGVGALCVAPHFLKNYVFYRNPFYPLLQDVFTNSRPRVPDASTYVKYFFTDSAWVPTGSLWARLKHSLELFFTFSFKPHYSCINYVPTFGSLFTLLLPGLVLVPARRAIAVTSVIGTGALLIWGFTYNLDRNLQTFMPVLVCVTGALLVQLWRLGWPARVGLVPLVMLQLVWGADAPFLPANGSYCSGSDRITSTIALIRSGFEGHAKSRFDGYFSNYVAIGKALPQDAKVLLHASHLSLGIDRDVLLDMAGYQGLITYSRVRTPRELFDYYRALGITHILDGPGFGEATRQEQALYYLFLTRYGISVSNNGGRLFQMPNNPPPDEAPYQVLCLGVHGYADGLYPVERLAAAERLPEFLRHYGPPEQPVTQGNIVGLLRRSAMALIGPTAHGVDDVKGELSTSFEQTHSHDGVTVYARRRPQ